MSPIISLKPINFSISPFIKPLKIFKLRKSTFKSINEGIKLSENLRAVASKRRLQRITYVIYEDCSKNKVNLHFFRKILIYSRIFMLSPSKYSPSDIIHLCQRFFQSSKHFWYSFFGMSLSSLNDSVFICSTVAKRRPFMGLFNLGNRKKSQGAKFGEYGGWGMITVFFLAKKLWISNDEWAGQNLAILERISLPHASDTKYPKKLHGLSQPICRHPQHFL